MAGVEKILCTLAAMTAFLFPAAASAMTEFTINLLRIYVGDDGYLWLHYTNGGAGYLSSSDPDKEGTLALATTALVSQRQMIVRYQADGVACTYWGRSDLIGVYLI